MARDSTQSGLEFILGLMFQDFMQFLHHSGLSAPQIHALLHIYHMGTCPVSEIGTLSGASPAAASQLVERLARQGLVQRTEDPQNRRVRRLQITAKGLRMLREGILSNGVLNVLMETLSPVQRQTVHEAFRYLAEAGKQIHSTPMEKAGQHA